MSEKTMTAKQTLVENLVATGTHGAKSTLSKKKEADLQAMWDAHLAEQENATVGEDEDLLGEVEGTLSTEFIDVEDIEEGTLVVTTRKRGKRQFVEVGRVRIGRKHVTVFDVKDRDIVWVPVGSKIEVASIDE
jgi:plasmid stabilization system protein ParE